MGGWASPRCQGPQLRPAHCLLINKRRTPAEPPEGRALLQLQHPALPSAHPGHPPSSRPWGPCPFQEALPCPLETLCFDQDSGAQNGCSVIARTQDGARRTKTSGWTAACQTHPVRGSPRPRLGSPRGHFCPFLLLVPSGQHPGGQMLVGTAATPEMALAWTASA